jgi:hypothetical protein
MSRTTAELKLHRAVRLALKLVDRGEIWEDQSGELWKRRASGTWLNIHDAANRGVAHNDGVDGKLGVTAVQISVWLDLALGALCHTGEIGVDKDGTACSDGRNRFRIRRTAAL